MNETPRHVYIYALCEPDTGEVRYIGKALNPLKRAGFHLTPSHMSHTSHKTRWLRQLLDRGQQPLLLILEHVTTRTWQEAEKDWIAHYQALGARLTNILEGGFGRMLPSEISQESRDKLSRAGKAHPHGPISPEHRVMLIALHTGRKRSPETRAKLSAKAKARPPVSAETRAKMSASHTGSHRSAETRASMRAAWVVRRRQARSA